MTREQPGERVDARVVPTESRDTEAHTAREMIDSLMQQLNTAKEDAFSSRCRLHTHTVGF